MEQEPATYTLELTEKKDIAHQTMEFRFKKPEGFLYRAGQSMRMKIPGTDEERTLSIVTAPHESDLAFAFRVRGSEFKKRLKRFEIGDKIIASGPNGKFGLHEDMEKPALYIAGGIGITIFVSILSHLEHNNFKHSITLLYSNRKEEDVSYLGRLREFEASCSNLRIVPVLTKEKPSNWRGELGRINREMIERYAPDIEKTLFYVTATPEMVLSMETLLKDMHVPDGHIYTKRFKGY